MLPPGVLDEKASACEALGIYASESGAAFVPYIEKAVEAISAMATFFVEDVRTVAYKSMGGIVKAVALAFPPAGPGQTSPQVLFILAVVPGALTMRLSLRWCVFFNMARGFGLLNKTRAQTLGPKL